MLAFHTPKVWQKKKIRGFIKNMIKKEQSKQINIKITQEEYELTKLSKHTQREIYQMGLTLINNETVETIQKKEYLQKKILENNNKIVGLKQQVKNLTHQTELLEKELEKITILLNEKLKNEKIEKLTQARELVEYTENTNYNRAVRNILHAYERSGFLLEDFINLKENYINRLCQSQGLNMDKLIILMKKEVNKINRN